MLVFHGLARLSGLGSMLRQLHGPRQGARANLQANLGRLGCTISGPILLGH